MTELLDIVNEILRGVELASIAAGVGAASVFAALAQTLVGRGADENYKRRMRIAQRDRSDLKDAFLAEKQARQRDQRNAKMLEDALAKLRLEKQLSSFSLRERLARAGIRRRQHQVIFLLAQVFLPPIVAAAALGVFHFWLKPPDAGFPLYACVGVGGAIIGFLLPGMRIDGMGAQRQHAIETALPDALDLMTICVEAGMSVEQGLRRVSKELGPHASVLSEEIELLTAELAYLGDRRAAFENFTRRTGAPTVKTIVSALVQAEKYGTPIGQALRVIAAESRFNRMAAAETKAAALPAKLTVPMMVFFVPALFVVILGPALLQITKQF